MTIDKAINLHGALKVFEAGAVGECENYAPLKALGLDVETIAGAELISHAAYDRLTVEEKEDILKEEAVREWYEERAGILEYDAGYSREEAERLALEMVVRVNQH